MTPMQHVQQDIRTKEFVVADLEVAARFWDPLMAFLGWRRADDGIGAVVYEGGSAAVVFTSGEVWDRAVNEEHRVNAFAHLAFDLRTREELESLAASLEEHTTTPVFGPRPVIADGRPLAVMDFQDPNGLDVEVRSTP